MLTQARRRRRPRALRVSPRVLRQLPAEQRLGLHLLRRRGEPVRRRLRAVVLLLPARCELEPDPCGARACPICMCCALCDNALALATDAARSDSGHASTDSFQDLQHCAAVTE